MGRFRVMLDLFEVMHVLNMALQMKRNFFKKSKYQISLNRGKTQEISHRRNFTKIVILSISKL